MSRLDLAMVLVALAMILAIALLIGAVAFGGCRPGSP